MSDVNISEKEDMENLLNISKQGTVYKHMFGEDDIVIRSSVSIYDPNLDHNIGSKTDQIEDEMTFKRSSRNIDHSRLKSFNITWSFGMNTAVGVKDLTNENNKELFFASVQHVILYNYENNKMRLIEGHVSGVYYTECFTKAVSKPVFTLPNPYRESEVLLMSLSPCARYLITIGKNLLESYQVDWWLWTTADDHPVDSLLVDELNAGLPLKISFNFNRTEHVMLVFEHQLQLVVWDTINNRFSVPISPEISNKSKTGQFTDGTYLNHCIESYVSSSKGFILIFRSTSYSKSYNERELNNSMLFINAIKVSTVSIGAMTSLDDLLVIGDAKGHIYFFDKQVRILYWIRQHHLGAINSISFPFLAKECLNKQNGSDTALESKILLVSQFFVSTNDSNIYSIDIKYDKCTQLFHNVYANVSALESHREKPIILIGYENGHISAVNYESKKRISYTALQKFSAFCGKDDDVMVTCIKYSLQSLHLICGRNNGEIWILEPTILAPMISEPFRCTTNRVEKIDFSHDSMQFAYYDADQIVILFNYDLINHCWQLKGRVQSHYERITDMKFFMTQQSNKSTLFTIGADRNMIEYNNNKIREDPTGNLAVTKINRIEQSAVPLTFEYYYKMVNGRKMEYFLMVDDKHKIKLVDVITKVHKSTALGPAYGCFRDTAIKKIMILPQHNYKYAVFICKRHIGVHILPPDGNPYKFLGYLAHPIEIADASLSFDGKYAFTFGIGDRCVAQWEIKIRSVEICHLLGGIELEPYYCLLEGGRSGWLFNEMQDLFCYMQILQQENINFPRHVTDTLRISEIPDLIRACGYFPSNFELENIMIDVRYKDDEIRDEINFTEFVKLFINHRPAYANSLEAIQSCFNSICEMAGGSTEIDKEHFVYLLENLGEPMENVKTILGSLLKASSGGSLNFDDFPETITFDFFCNDLLGIDTSREMNKLNNIEDTGDGTFPNK